MQDTIAIEKYVFILSKCGGVEIFGSDTKKPKMYE
jgi:hypothetical protein